VASCSWSRRDAHSPGTSSSSSSSTSFPPLLPGCHQHLRPQMSPCEQRRVNARPDAARRRGGTSSSSRRLPTRLYPVRCRLLRRRHNIGLGTPRGMLRGWRGMERWRLGVVDRAVGLPSSLLRRWTATNGKSKCTRTCGCWMRIIIIIREIAGRLRERATKVRCTNISIGFPAFSGPVDSR